MIKKLAERITERYIKKKKIKEEEREVYVYSFELLISTIINCLLVLVGAIISGLYLEALIFSICFMTMRGVAGGYHSSTHGRCIFSLGLIIAVFCLACRFIDISILQYISLAFLGLSIIGILVLAPIDSANKPLSISEYRKNKKKAILLGGIYTVVGVILWIFEVTRWLTFSIAYSLFIVFILLIIGRIINIKRERGNIEIKGDE